MSGILHLLGLVYSLWLKHTMRCFSALLVGSCSPCYKERMSGILHSLGLAYLHWLRHTERCCRAWLEAHAQQELTKRACPEFPTCWGFVYLH